MGPFHPVMSPFPVSPASVCAALYIANKLYHFLISKTCCFCAYRRTDSR